MPRAIVEVGNVLGIFPNPTVTRVRNRSKSTQQDEAAYKYMNAPPEDKGFLIYIKYIIYLNCNEATCPIKVLGRLDG